MKIGIVLYPTYGGSGVVATELGMALAAKGHEVHFITYSQPVRLDLFADNIYYHEVVVNNYPLFDYPPYETVLAGKMVDVVKFEKLDLLHVHYAIPHASAAFLAQQILKSHGIYIPFVTTLHGTDITLVGRDPAIKPVIQYCLEMSDAVTSVSHSLKKDTIEHFNIQRDIEVIPNFIQLNDYTTETNFKLRRRYALDNEFVITHISNFRKVKRVEDVVHIFKKISDVLPSKLVLVGDGPERQKVEELCRTLGTCEKVVLLGKMQATHLPLSMSDLFLLPSETESFGLAALEAMAAGVPVISSNTGGLSEVNEEGFSGFLANVGDVETMADKAIGILSSKESLDRFKKQARENAKRFDIDEILPIYEKLYLDVLEAARVSH
jgi:N-acetyl-alpha-D-glucosaminyl L-malate synthase BshA